MSTFLFFDVETTGMPRNWKAPVSDTFNWPRVVQIAWQAYDEDRRCTDAQDFIIKPEGWEIPYESERIHKISTEKAQEEGVDLKDVLHQFAKAIDEAEYIIAHNLNFDEKVIGAEFIRKSIEHRLFSSERYCTMQESTYFCRLPGKGGRFKWPTLQELHEKLFGARFADAHNALADTQATANCFFRLIDIEAIDVLD